LINSSTEFGSLLLNYPAYTLISVGTQRFSLPVMKFWSHYDGSEESVELIPITNRIHTSVRHRIYRIFRYRQQTKLFLLGDQIKTVNIFGVCIQYNYHGCITSFEPDIRGRFQLLSSKMLVELLQNNC
jgi:hypothetical protein